MTVKLKAQAVVAKVFAVEISNMIRTLPEVAIGDQKFGGYWVA